MSLTLVHITLDCADPRSLSSFWSAALDRAVDEGAGDYFASIDHGDGDRPSWFFIKVSEPKSGKNRMHIDFRTEDREAEVSRMRDLGATRLSDHDEWGAVWTVMADPEGNEFCVAQRPLRA